MYSNTQIRPLTVEDSDTNTAHSIWYEQFTPVQRLDVMVKVDPSLPLNLKLNACLNYIEDNLSLFVGEK